MKADIHPNYRDVVFHDVTSDFKILTRSLLTGIPEVEEFMIPVPFPHEDNARELGLHLES